MECETEGCGNLAQLTVTMSVNRVTPTETAPWMIGKRKVCTDCGPEMAAINGWEIVGVIDRDALVR